jgi:hypothetical protein
MEKAIKIIEGIMKDICENDDEIHLYWDSEYFAYYALKKAKDRIQSEL